MKVVCSEKADFAKLEKFSKPKRLYSHRSESPKQKIFRKVLPFGRKNYSFDFYESISFIAPGEGEETFLSRDV